MKIKLLATILLFILNLALSSQTPNWQWAKSAGGNFSEYSRSMAVDPAGNVFVTGYFDSQSITFGTTTFTNRGVSDIFIVKYDASGNVIWAKTEGGSGAEDVGGISVDLSGNVLITGNFNSAALAIGNVTLTNTNASTTTDIFVAKYDASGNFIWALCHGGTDDEKSRGICTDTGGNIYVTGIFKSPAFSFVTLSISNASPGKPDIYVAKYDAAGNPVWAKNFGGQLQEYADGIKTDANGNVFISGFSDSPTLSFAGGQMLNSGNSAQDIFIAKYDASGNEIWARKSTGTAGGKAWGGALAVDAAGNIFISGGYGFSSISFGSTSLTMNTTGSNKADVYLVKFDPSGNTLWARNGTGPYNDYSYGLSTDGAGNVFIAGSSNSSLLTFGTYTLMGPPIGFGSPSDIFIVKCDATGNFKWAEKTGGYNSSSDEAIGAGNDAAGNLYVTGNFYSPSLAIGATTLTNASNSTDIFVAKFAGAGGTGIIEENTKNSITVFPNPFCSETILRRNHPLNNATITLHNSLGQAVKTISDISGKEFILSRDNLPEGLYFIGLCQEGKIIANEKIVISD